MPNLGFSRGFSSLPAGLRRPAGAAALLLLAALAGGLGFAGAVPAAAQADAPETPFLDVPVDLSGRLFEQVLPFDVPFLIHGDVPATTQTVEVRFIGQRRPFRVCDPALPRAGQPPCPNGRLTCFEKNRDGSESAHDCSWQPAGGGPIVWEQEIPPPAAAQTVTFRVPVPPLEAKSYYVFSFGVRRTLTTDDLTQFQARARTALDPALRQIPGTAATAEQNEALRQELVRQLEAAAGNGLELVQANLFNLAVPYGQLDPQFKVEFNRLVGEVLNSQDRVRSNITARARNQPQLEAELTAVADAQALDDLIVSLEAVAGAGQPASGLVRQFLDTHQQALRFAAFSPGERANLALGLPPEGPATGTAPAAFDERIDAAAAGQYAANYGTTAQQLTDLQEWLSSLVEGSNTGLLDAAVAAGPLTRAAADDPQSGLAATLLHVRRARGLANALANNARQVAVNQDARTAAIAALAAEAEVQAAAAAVVLDASTLGSFKTQQAWYIAADFGFAYGPDISKVVPYIGTNVYFRPVNKNAPLSERSSFGRRFSFTLGLTVKSIADQNPATRSDLFDNNSLLVGVGYRLTDSGRLGLGALVFEESDPNPLLQDESLTFSPYLSLSFDWDVLSFFRGFGTIFGNPPG